MWWPDYQLRLFRRGKGAFLQNQVHRALSIEGKTEKLENPMIHINYTSVSQFVAKLNNYTDIEAENMIKKDYGFNFLDALRFPVDDFLKTFFMQKGYRDGLHGLVLGLLQAFYMEVVFAKLWERHNFRQVEEKDMLSDLKKEIISTGRKIKYWIKTTVINDATNPLKKTLLRLSRKVL
jgi:hypothetical protein